MFNPLTRLGGLNNPLIKFKMDVILDRLRQDEKGTYGTLIVFKGKQVIGEFCTLELPWNNNKKNASCIPKGRYKMVFEYSPKFKENLWELKGVKDRDEIKIHPFNSKAPVSYTHLTLPTIYSV